MSVVLLQGAVPQEQIPFVMNPKDGILVAGNSVIANDPKRIFGEVFVPGCAHANFNSSLFVDFSDTSDPRRTCITDLHTRRQEHHQKLVVAGFRGSCIA